MYQNGGFVARKTELLSKLEMITDTITIKYPTTDAVLDFEKKVDKRKHIPINAFPHKKKKRIKRTGSVCVNILIEKRKEVM